MQGVTKSRCPFEYHLFPQERGSAERCTWDELPLSSLRATGKALLFGSQERRGFVKELLSSRLSDWT